MTHKLFCRPITKEDVILQLLIDCLGKNIAVTYQTARHFAREWIHKELKGTCLSATLWQTNTQELEGNNCPTQLHGRKCFLHKGFRIGPNQHSDTGPEYTKDESTHTTPGSQKDQAAKYARCIRHMLQKHNMMLQKHTSAHVKRGMEFHWGLEARSCLGFIHRRIFPIFSGANLIERPTKSLLPLKTQVYLKSHQ